LSPRGKRLRFLVPIAGAALTMALLVAVGARSVSRSSGRGNVAAAAARVAQGYGELPVSFEPNRGQSDPHVRFLARGNGYRLFLTKDEAVLSLGGKKAAAAPVRMHAVGANRDPEVVGERRLRGRANYLVGRDPRAWLTDVPTYAAVRYRGLYPGIDQVFYGAQTRLEYDFVVAAAADPNAIRLAFSGAKSLSLGRGGELLLALPGGTLRQPRPVAYQEVAGERRAVEARYSLDRGHVGFAIGRYDHARPLVIDPKIDYATYLGRQGFEWASGIAVGADGSAYVTGPTFAVAAGAIGPGGDEDGDVFVTKLDPTGSAAEYSTYFGGSDWDDPRDIAVDERGRAYVTGMTISNDFPTTDGAAHGNIVEDRFVSDAFVTKLSGDGTSFKYSTYLGGHGADAGNGIAVDADERAYVTGATGSSDFPVTPGAFQTAGPDPEEGEDTSHAFVTKLSREGTYLKYSTYLGGTGVDGGVDIAVDGDERAYVTGGTGSRDFPTTVGAFRTDAAGGIFVTKLSSQGTDLKYSTYLATNSWSTGIAVDRDERAYVTGFTLSSDFPTTPGAFQSVDPDPGSEDEVNNDGFVVKLGREGTHLKYGTYLGGHGYDGGHAIAVDADGRAYVTGLTWSPDFPTTPDAPLRGPTSSCDPPITSYVTKLSTDGSELRFSTYLPQGDISDVPSEIAVDAHGNFYVAGATVSRNCPTTPGALQPVAGGGFDAFVTKFAQ
jgi:Beta-propeller repeat